jgi:hypothetical protein
MQIPPKFGDIEFPPKIQQASSRKKCEYNSNLILLGIHTFFGFASMSSLAKKLKDELQAFLKILILIARSLRGNIKDQKVLVKVKVEALEELEHSNGKVKVEVRKELEFF